VSRTLGKTIRKKCRDNLKNRGKKKKKKVFEVRGKAISKTKKKKKKKHCVAKSKIKGGEKRSNTIMGDVSFVWEKVLFVQRWDRPQGGGVR